MASILPINTDLGDKQEGTSVLYTFTGQIEALEELVSIEVTSWTENPGINVEGAIISGEYQSAFILKDSLKYREGDMLKTCNAFEELPKGVSVYSFTAPGTLTKIFTYQVEMIYKKFPPTTDPPTPNPPDPEILTITKTYSQTVFGDYDIWANQLKKYLRDNP